MADAEEKIEVLKAQLQTMRDSDKRIFEAIRFCTGTLLAMAGLLVGYGWFTNSLNYDREREALRKELAFSVREAEAGFAERAKSLEELMHRLSSNHVAEVLLAQRAAETNLVMQLNAILKSDRAAAETNFSRLTTVTSASLAFEEAQRLALGKNYGYALQKMAYAATLYLELNEETMVGRCLANLEAYMREFRTRDAGFFREVEGPVTNALSKISAADKLGKHRQRVDGLVKEFSEGPRRSFP